MSNGDSSMTTGEIRERVIIHERLVRIETMLESIQSTLKDQKECDKDQMQKLDKILENDKDKIERITKSEEKIKHVYKVLCAFILPLVAGLLKWFI